MTGPGWWPHCVSCARTPYPPGLRGYLLPDTNADTLANLSGSIELLMAEDDLDGAVSVASAALDMLRQIANRAAEVDPSVAELPQQAEQAHRDLAEADLRGDRAPTGADGDDRMSDGDDRMSDGDDRMSDGDERMSDGNG